MSVRVTSDSQWLVEPGDAIDYTITVTNDGPDAVVDARLSDTFSSVFRRSTLDRARQAQAHRVPVAGSGILTTWFSLIPGGVATYLVTANVGAAAEGPISSQVTVTAPNNLQDIGAANNVATHSYVVLPFDSEPVVNSSQGTADSTLTIDFDADIAAETVSPAALTVHASQSGASAQPSK